MLESTVMVEKQQKFPIKTMTYQSHDSCMLHNYNEPLTISPVAAQCNGACGKRSSIECVHIDRCWPQKSWRWRLRSTVNLDSDKFRCFNHRDELDSTVFLPTFRSVTLLQSRASQPLVTMIQWRVQDLKEGGARPIAREARAQKI